MENQVSEKLFRHMAWANEKIFTQVSGLPEEALQYSAWNPDWTVGTICNHIVIAQGRLLARLRKESAPDDFNFPLTRKGLQDLVKKSKSNDEAIIKLIHEPEEMLTFIRFGEEVSFLRSTVLWQTIHHATDHRTQIADILECNGMSVINLDELDLWHFEKSGV